MINEEDVSVSTLFDQQYAEAENKDQLDYSAPLAQLVSECVEARTQRTLSQESLAKRMKTKQSVISRFEIWTGARLMTSSRDFLWR